MGFLFRLFQRVFIFIVSIGVIWLIVTQIFDRLDQRLPLFFALILTYFFSAYFILPQIIHFSVMIMRRGRIPRVTRAADGLFADPVNIILAGTIAELSSVFYAMGWHKADKLTFKNGLKMIRCFLLNRPYPEAPFSPLYLFGRKQDIGFQKVIGNSPRKRHHVRFWSANIDPRKEISDIAYWLKKHPADPSASYFWVGSGSEDIGFGLTKLTFQISHRTDKNIDKERDYILDSLRRCGCINSEHFIEAGELVAGKYISDGKIIWAEITSSKQA